MASRTPSPSELRFAALVTYCPRGRVFSQTIAASQQLMLQVKENRIVQVAGGAESAARFVARRLREIRPPFTDEFLGRETTLVPIPRSGLPQPDALWPALEIAKALQAEGFGAAVLPCLRRVLAVPKAARAPLGGRPRAQTHFNSLEVEEPFDLPGTITLVDDVITRGAQLLGAAQRLQTHRADVRILAFAVLRTMSRPEVFSKILDPCTGSIELRGVECFRAP